MPLVFMAGGMLDRLGGAGLPGRCETMQEARKMIERILNDDMDLIHQIRSSQSVMLHAVASEDLELEWRTGLARILDELTASRSALAARPSINRRKRIAVIVPIGYRGGTLRGAQLLAEAIFLGSRQAEEPVDVVLVHRDMPEYYPEEEFAGLPSEIARRTFNWKIMNQSEARRAMRYAGFSGWEPSMQQYQVPDDGIQQLQDCDLWLFVSDRLSLPVLPLKPIALMVYDYLQRYVDILPHEMNMSFLDAARQAQRIFVTTDFNFCDAVQYAGLDPQKVCKVPMLTPDFGGERRDQSRSEYFIWTTNPALHKNHARAAEALRIYYDELDGQLDCWVTGADTYRILEGGASYLDDVSKIFERSPSLRSHVHWRGELSDAAYRHCLGGASFLWHAGRVDNGTFSVVEAAHMGVPALSSDYPAMKEMDARFSLNLAWMNPYSPRHMAEQLKKMEKEVELRQSMLPSAEQLDQQGLEVLALCYWEELRKCL
jgi:glycosyltransferase involved in cell wall biosynthesis